ncbi:MAG: hypothetical protein FD169_1256 [Bacillota bacterium]|nr:MAG: hypothetical protein FD169_1256 [Bacillota bacterium]
MNEEALEVIKNEYVGDEVGEHERKVICSRQQRILRRCIHASYFTSR